MAVLRNLKTVDLYRSCLCVFFSIVLTGFKVDLDTVSRTVLVCTTIARVPPVTDTCWSLDS